MEREGREKEKKEREAAEKRWQEGGVGEREGDKEGTVREEEEHGEGEQVQGVTNEEQIHKDEQNKEKGRKQRKFVLVFKNRKKELLK